MSDIDGIRAGRHCAFALHAHLVFVTKFPHKVFSDRHLTRIGGRGTSRQDGNPIKRQLG
ncbi:hypothetical protein [Micromonospora sp. L31]|uniref:hypothetical protein n=1 Tax=Micromonospora sp. L31 TaxID=3452213 RepID=UPI003F8C5139